MQSKLSEALFRFDERISKQDFDTAGFLQESFTVLNPVKSKTRSY